jgi:hypothetical protein
MLASFRACACDLCGGAFTLTQQLENTLVTIDDAAPPPPSTSSRSTPSRSALPALRSGSTSRTFPLFAHAGCVSKLVPAAVPGFAHHASMVHGYNSRRAWEGEREMLRAPPAARYRLGIQLPAIDDVHTLRLPTGAKPSNAWAPRLFTPAGIDSDTTVPAHVPQANFDIDGEESGEEGVAGLEVDHVALPGLV